MHWVRAAPAQCVWPVSGGEGRLQWKQDNWAIASYSLRRAASAHGPWEEADGPGVGARKMTTTRSRRFMKRSITASTGLIQRPSTVWAIPRKWSIKLCGDEVNVPTSLRSVNGPGTRTGKSAEP